MSLPTIKYADNTDHWEKWMHGFYYGAFYIFPPSGVIETVDELRNKYDSKSASYCRGHISVSDMLTSPITEKQLIELRDVLSEIKPFQIHYGPVRSIPPYPGVVYRIDPEDKFNKLRSAIHSTSIFPDNNYKKKTPHMTIAELITQERTEELLNELKDQVQEGDFLCGSIEYAVPNNDFHFESVLSIPIGKDVRL